MTIVNSNDNVGSPPLWAILLIAIIGGPVFLLRWFYPLWPTTPMGWVRQVCSVSAIKMLVALVLIAFAGGAMGHEVSLEVTDKTIDGADYFPAIEPLFYAVSIYDGPAQYKHDLAKFSREQRYVLACHWYLSEVFNGGHDQFYFNDTGIVWQDARDGFIAIGAPEVAKIIEESARRMGGKPNAVREVRQKQLDQSGASFDDLDQQLYDLDKRRDLSKLLVHYVRAHRSHFYYSGIVDKPDIVH